MNKQGNSTGKREAEKPVIANPTMLAGAAQADLSSLANLYDCYYGRVYNYIRYRCDDPDTADDLTAQVFERLLGNLHKYSPERGLFEPWLFAIVRNIVSDHFRSQKRISWLPWEVIDRQPARESSLEERVIQRQAHAALSNALQQLTEKERDLLGLKFAGGLNNRQIASMVGMSESNVGVTLYRAINHLRTLLGEGDARSDLQETGYERA